MIMSNKILEKLKTFLETDEGKESMQRFSEKLSKRHAFEERWAERVLNFLEHKSDEDLRILFENFETHSEKRREILWNQRIDGQSSLYNPLLKVFEELGEEAPKEAYGMFSSSIFDWRGYRIELYCGQGSFYSLSRL